MITFKSNMFGKWTWKVHRSLW